MPSPTRSSVTCTSSPSASALRKGKYSFSASGRRSPCSTANRKSDTRASPWNQGGLASDDDENTASPTSIATPSSHGGRADGDRRSPCRQPKMPDMSDSRVEESPRCCPAASSSAPPQTGDITASGPIHSRTTSSLLSRGWKPAYWAHIYPATLVVFQSRDDFEEWRDAYVTAREELIVAGGERGKWDGSNDRLVRIGIDLDPMGILRKRERKERRRREREAKKMKHQEEGGGSGGQNSKKKKKKDEEKKAKKSKEKEERGAERAAAAAAMANVVKYAMTDVRSKSGRNGSTMHTFKIEKWTESGTSVAASFASSEPREVKELRRVIRESISALQKGATSKGKAMAAAAAAGSRTMDAKILSDGRSPVSGASTALHSAHDSDDGATGLRVCRRMHHHGRPGSNVASNLSCG